MNDWTSIINQLTVVDIQAQIIRGPANQAAFIGDTAIFNCSMDCSNQAPVSWYFTLPSNLKAGIVSPFTQPNQIKSIYGMEVSRRTVNECPQGGYIVEQFLVTASRQLNLMPVQCSTLSDGGCGKKIQVYFSITALLKVADIVPTITSTPSDARTSPTPSNIGVDEATTKRICEDPDIAGGILVTEYSCFPERAPSVSSPSVLKEDNSAGGDLQMSGHAPPTMINSTQSCSKEVSHQSSYLQEGQKYFPVPTIDKSPPVGKLSSNKSALLSDRRTHNFPVGNKPSEQIQNSADIYPSGWPKCFTPATEKSIPTEKNLNSTSSLITSFSSNCWTYNRSFETSEKIQNSTDISPSGWPKCYIPVAEKSLHSEKFQISDTDTSSSGLTRTTAVSDKPLPLENKRNIKSNLITSFSSNCWTYNPSVEDKLSEKIHNSTDTSPSGWPKCFIPVAEKSLPSEENQNLAPSTHNPSCCTTSIEDTPIPSKNVANKHSLDKKIHVSTSNTRGTLSNLRITTSIADKLLPSEEVQNSVSRTNASSSDCQTSKLPGPPLRFENPDDFVSHTSTYPGSFYHTSIGHLEPATMCCYENPSAHPKEEFDPLGLQIHGGPNFAPPCHSLIRPPFGPQAGPQFGPPVFGPPYGPPGAPHKDPYQPPYHDTYDPSVGFDTTHYHPCPPIHWEGPYNNSIYQHPCLPPPGHAHRTYGPEFRPGAPFHLPPTNTRPLPLIPRPPPHSTRPPLMPAPFPLVRPRPLPLFCSPMGFRPPQESVGGSRTSQDAWNAAHHHPEQALHNPPPLSTPKPHRGPPPPYSTSRRNMRASWGQEGGQTCHLLANAGGLMGTRLQECSRDEWGNDPAPIWPEQHGFVARQCHPCSLGAPSQLCADGSSGSVRGTPNWSMSVAPDDVLPSSTTLLTQSQPLTSQHTSRDPPLTTPSTTAPPTKPVTTFTKAVPTEVATPFTTASPTPAFGNSATTTAIQVAEISAHPTPRAPPISSSATMQNLTYAEVCAPPLTTHAPPLTTHAPPLIAYAPPHERSGLYSCEVDKVESQRDKEGWEIVSSSKKSVYSSAVLEGRGSVPSDHLMLGGGSPPTHPFDVTALQLISFQPFSDAPTDLTMQNGSKEKSHSLNLPSAVHEMNRATKASKTPCKSVRSRSSGSSESNVPQFVMKIPKLSKEGTIMTSGPATVHQSPLEACMPSGSLPYYSEQKGVDPPAWEQDTTQVYPPAWEQDTAQVDPPAWEQDTTQVDPPAWEQDTTQVDPPAWEQDTTQDVKGHYPHPIQQISGLGPPQLERTPHPLQHNRIPQVVPHPSRQGNYMPHPTDEYQQQTGIRFQLKTLPHESEHLTQAKHAHKYSVVCPPTGLPQYCGQPCLQPVIKMVKPVQSDKQALLLTATDQSFPDAGVQEQEMAIAQPRDQYKKCATAQSSQKQHNRSVSYGFPSSFSSCMVPNLAHNASTKTSSNATQVHSIGFSQNKSEQKSLENSCIVEVEPQHTPKAVPTSRVASSKGDTSVASAAAMPEWGRCMAATFPTDSISKELTPSKHSSNEVISSELNCNAITDFKPASKVDVSCHSDLDEVNNLETVCSIFQNELDKLEPGLTEVSQEVCVTPMSKKAARHKKKRERKRKSHHK
eukprot:Em0005g234a